MAQLQAHWTQSWTGTNPGRVCLGMNVVAHPSSILAGSCQPPTLLTALLFLNVDLRGHAHSPPLTDTVRSLYGSGIHSSTQVWKAAPPLRFSQAPPPEGKLRRGRLMGRNVAPSAAEG